MSDPIDALPTDQSMPSHPEIQILDTLFKQQYTTAQKIFAETKDVMLVGLLFIFFSIPQIDDIIKRFIPSTETSLYIMIFVKSLLVMLSYFILKNLYLVRRKK